MKGRHTSHRRVETLNHIWMVDLVDNHIELVSICKRIHFKLITPNSILFHVLAVLVYCFVILDKRDEIILVQPDVVDCCMPIIHMQTLIALKLISNRSKKAVPIPYHLLNFKSKRQQLLLKFLQILGIQVFIKFLLISFLLPSRLRVLLPLFLLF